MQTWDEFFLRVCNVMASNSKCLSRNIGAILVRDKTIISQGYNGPPRGVPHCNKRYIDDSVLWDELVKKLNILPDDYSDWVKTEEERLSVTCPRQILGYKSGDGLHLCIASHAERNTIVNAAREGVCTKGSIMYMNCGIPCNPCMVEILNAGITELVCTNLNTYDKMSEYLVKKSGIKVRVFDCDVSPESESKYEDNTK